MKWIKDRNPISSGMYAIRLQPTYELESFKFAYFDGKGWLIPSQSGDEVFPYRGTPEWSKIDWGQDER